MIFFKPGDIVKFKPDRSRRTMMPPSPRWTAGTFEPRIRPVTFSLDEFHADPDGDQREALGGAPWRLKSSSPAFRPPSRTSGGPAITISASRISGGMDHYALIAANLLVGNPTKAPPCSRRSFWGPRSSSTPTRPSPSPAPKCRRRSTASSSRPGRRSPVKAGQTLSFGFLKSRRARLYRRLRRHRRAGRARLALDLSARRARRLRGPAAESGRPAGRRRRQRAAEARPQRSPATCGAVRARGCCA